MSAAALLARAESSASTPRSAAHARDYVPVGPANDAYETEAERVADAVSARSAAGGSRTVAPLGAGGPVSTSLSISRLVGRSDQGAGAIGTSIEATDLMVDRILLHVDERDHDPIPGLRGRSSVEAEEIFGQDAVPRPWRAQVEILVHPIHEMLDDVMQQTNPPRREVRAGRDCTDRAEVSCVASMRSRCGRVRSNPRPRP